MYRVFKPTVPVMCLSCLGVPDNIYIETPSSFTFDYKIRMILLFIHIAIIRIAAPAVFTFTAIKFKRQMSTAHQGFVSSFKILSKNKADLAR